VFSVTTTLSQFDLSQCPDHSAAGVSQEILNRFASFLFVVDAGILAFGCGILDTSLIPLARG